MLSSSKVAKPVDGSDAGHSAVPIWSMIPDLSEVGEIDVGWRTSGGGGGGGGGGGKPRVA